jgi:hypothetical protein
MRKFTVAVMLMLLTSCTVVRFNLTHYDDANHPCTIGQPRYSKSECEGFQKKYPRDYAQYQQRMNQYHAAGLRVMPYPAWKNVKRKDWIYKVKRKPQYR